VKSFAHAIARITVAASLCASAAAYSQAYPSKPILLIVSSAAGAGIADMTPRLIQPKVSEALGQPLIVENRAGATGRIASEFVARSKPDGYTLLAATTSTHVTNRFTSKNVPYDSLKDFTPITLSVEAVEYIVAHPSVQANTIKELIDDAKRNPGKRTYADTGIGSVAHMTMELFKLAAGVDILHVPYKTLPQAVTDVMTGRVELIMISQATLRPQLGKLKALAVLTSVRSPAMPEVPTVYETLPNYWRPSSWFGFFGPPALPQSILRRLHDEIVKALNAPDIRPKLIEAGALVVGNTPEEFAARIKSEIEKTAAVVKVLGIEPE
jgi:tripartite-type tricarboxylate transporter receptor subunit TctC